MVWFKVDDKLHDHRKPRRAGVGSNVNGLAAMGLWGLAGSYSADNLTDGFVPEHTLTRWAPSLPVGRKLARLLVDAGLWHPAVVDGEAGWVFHEWEDRQPTRAQVEAERAAAAERMRNRRKRGGSGDVRANTDRTSTEVRLPRPDPTRPNAAAAALATAAAAAAADPGGPTDPVLPTPIAILRSKLQAYSALQALRFDDLGPDRTAQLLTLIDTHGDARLVDHAIRTCRTPPPISVTAFLGTWAALPPPGRTVAAVPDPPCTQPGHSGTTRHCTQCAAERLAGGI